jgi:Uma2 family endonuclease
MAIETLVSVQEYLSTDYEPDCDYVDGVLEERNLGEQDHSRLQSLLIAFCVAHEKQWRTRCLTEQRVQVLPTRFRVPDVAIVDLDNRDPILTKPPLVCIEVLSPEDRLNRVIRRAEDFLDMGVAEVWIIDPQPRRCYRHTKAEGFHEVPSGILATSDGRITLNVAELGD